MRGLDARDCAQLPTSWIAGAPPAICAMNAGDDCPHLLRRLLPRRATRAPLTVICSFARDAIAKHLQQLGGRNAHDAAVVVIDNDSGRGACLRWLLGRLSAAGEVDAARAPRQAGLDAETFHLRPGH